MEQEYQKMLERSRSRKSQYKKLAVQDALKKTRRLSMVCSMMRTKRHLKNRLPAMCELRKTTGPLWTGKDIERAANSLQMKPSVFTAKYLKIDEDQDHVLQKQPCTFLGKDNYCSIYESRPEASKDYPTRTVVK